MPYLNSSAIRQVEYNANTRVMQIWFKQGGPYNFCGVPQTIYDGLISAGRAGTYYDNYVRDRYQC